MKILNLDFTVLGSSPLSRVTRGNSATVERLSALREQLGTQQKLGYFVVFHQNIIFSHKKHSICLGLPVVEDNMSSLIITNFDDSQIIQGAQKKSKNKIKDGEIFKLYHIMGFHVVFYYILVFFIIEKVGVRVAGVRFRGVRKIILMKLCSSLQISGKNYVMKCVFPLEYHLR